MGSGWLLSIALHAALVFAATRVVQVSDARDVEVPESALVLDLRSTNLLPRVEERVREASGEVRSDRAPAPPSTPLLEPTTLDFDHEVEALFAEGASDALATNVTAAGAGSRSASIGASISTTRLPRRPVAASTTAPGSSGTGGETGSGGDSAEPTGPSVAFAPPELIESPDIEYPSRSRRANEEGQVKCRMHVTALGLVEAVEIVVSSGFSRLDDAARRGLAKWKFKPGTRDGIASNCLVDHTVTFRLVRTATNDR